MSNECNPGRLLTLIHLGSTLRTTGSGGYHILPMEHIGLLTWAEMVREFVPMELTMSAFSRLTVSSAPASGSKHPGLITYVGENEECRVWWGC